jgi:excisionase family DNA binding protein
MRTPADNRYLAPSEVAHLLNASKSSVYRAVESGDLPHVQLRPNGAVRIPRDELEAKAREREETRA